jgi:hypothetical protein
VRQWLREQEQERAQERLLLERVAPRLEQQARELERRQQAQRQQVRQRQQSARRRSWLV